MAEGDETWGRATGGIAMYVVVNGLRLAKPIDDTIIKKVESDFIPGARGATGLSELAAGCEL